MAKRKPKNRVAEFDAALTAHVWQVRRYWELVHAVAGAKSAMAQLRQGEVDDAVLTAKNQALTAFDKQLSKQLTSVQRGHHKLVVLFATHIPATSRGKSKCTTTITQKRSQRSR